MVVRPTWWKSAFEGPMRTAGVVVLACLGLALAFLLAGGLLKQLAYQWFTLAHPYIVNPMEGREAVKAWMLACGASLYPAQPGESFIVTIYPPLYHLATRLAAFPVGDYLLAGRLVSLASTLAVAAIIAAWARDATGNRLIAGLAGLSFLADPFMPWGVQARPDMLAHALALGGAYLFSRATHPGQVVVAALLAAAGLFTKQQMLPFIIGTALWGLAAGRDKRRLLPAYLAALAVFTVVPGMVLNWATDGQFVTDIITYPKRMGESPGIFSMENMLGRLRTLWAATAFKTVLTGIWAVACVLALRLDFALALVAINLPFVLRILGTWGADYNYALGIVILMYPCLAMLASRLACLPKAGAALAAAVFILANLDGGATFSGKILDNPHQGKWEGVQAELALRLRQAAGPVLANTEGGQLFLGQGLDDKLVFVDAIEMGLFEKAGFWTFADSALARDIAARKFSLIALSNRFIPPGMGWLLASHYLPLGVVGQYELFAPRTEDAIVQVGGLSFPLRSGEVSVALVEQENVKLAGDHIEPEDQSRPARLTLQATAAKPLKELGLALFPRLNHADGSSLEVVIADLSGKRLGAWECPRLPGRSWSGEWEMQAFERFPLEAHVATVTFVLTGNAQLYFTRQRPMSLYFTARE